MAALALAMLLTGAGPIGEGEQRRRPAPPPPIIMPAPVQPMPRIMPTPPPPPPARAPVPPQRARANLNAYFSVDDYPAAALRGNHQGTVGFRLVIAPTGRVSDCGITASSGSVPLDQATCRILRSRARYTPARDAYGNPTSATDSGRVTWLLPGWPRSIPIPAVNARLRGGYESLVAARDYPAAALRGGASGETHVRVVVGPNGRVIACDIDDSSGSVALDAAACRIIRARARFTPARSAAGAAVCGVDFGPVRWQPPPPGRRPPRIRAGPPPVAPPPVEQQLAPGACPGRAP